MISTDKDISEYVVGFLFNERGDEVVLLEKERPSWQKGMLNGVGGHLKERESSVSAMHREAEEEAAIETNWHEFCVLTDMRVWVVHFFCAFDDEAFKTAETKTDERVVRFRILNLPFSPAVIPNLKWLIPMAQNTRNPLERCGSFVVTELSGR